MTQEERNLLLMDLRSRLPYGEDPVYTLGEFTWKDDEPTQKTIDGTLYDRLYLQLCVYKTDYMNFKPYLRPMSSMTEEEREELTRTCMGDKCDEDGVNTDASNITSLLLYYGYFLLPIDWLLEHHFDFRGLIEKGLAIEAPIDMYKTK